MTREQALDRVLWGVQNGARVELRPGGPVAPEQARAHVRAVLGEEAARRVVALPALRERNVRPVHPLRA